MKNLKWDKVFIAILNGDKLPRKIKKQLLGKRMSKAKLRRLVASVVIEDKATTMYEGAVILPYAFCPKCGCRDSRGSGNWAEYPEHWENFYCIRCNNIVAQVDNSPLIHCLEVENNDFALNY